jgi:1-aminocyclopropane-1-carboxylate deaminase/D-cysteine desulfhydrase-like pyridoxal-dependent ACC family enzyme
VEAERGVEVFVERDDWLRMIVHGRKS